MFTRPVPEIDVLMLGEKLKSDERFVLLDVREPVELERARLIDQRVEVVPMSRFSREGANAIPAALSSKEETVYVMCHHGVRSAEVTRWLSEQGWSNVFSVRGGIDEYARNVDKRVGTY